MTEWPISQVCSAYNLGHKSVSCASTFGYYYGPGWYNRAFPWWWGTCWYGVWHQVGCFLTWFEVLSCMVWKTRQGVCWEKKVHGKMRSENRWVAWLKEVRKQVSCMVEWGQKTGELYGWMKSENMWVAWLNEVRKQFRVMVEWGQKTVELHGCLSSENRWVAWLNEVRKQGSCMVEWGKKTGEVHG